MCLSWRATDLCLGGFEVKNNTEALNCNVQSTDVKKGRYERGSKKLSVRPTIQRSNEKGQTTIKKIKTVKTTQ
jgi:hypothetical protein